MWLILRTDFRKEAYVACQIEHMGFDAWVPSEKRFVRICRHSKQRKITEHALIPKLLFAAVPVSAERDLLKIRHMVAVERNAALEPVLVPARQVETFMAEVDRINTAILALATKPSKREKAQWKPLKEALLDAIARAKEELSEAA